MARLLGEVLEDLSEAELAPVLRMLTCGLRSLALFTMPFIPRETRTQTRLNWRAVDSAIDTCAIIAAGTVVAYPLTGFD
jgi:hypothetical protein